MRRVLVDENESLGAFGHKIELRHAADDVKG